MTELHEATLWERIERQSPAPRPVLTHERIAEAAIQIADAEGPDAVSMRHLAERLGVATMALYRYVSSKRDIFELMIDGAHAGIDLPEGDWRTVARTLAEQLRIATLRHPWLIQVSSRTPTALTPRVLAILERSLASMDGLGLDVDSMMAVVSTINAFVRGQTASELALREVVRQDGATPADDPRSLQARQARWLIGTGRYPTLTRYIVEGSNRDDEEWRFEFALACILDGISARLGI